MKVSANPTLADNPKVAALAQQAHGFVSSFSGVGFDQAFASMIRGAVLLLHRTATP
ncbi:MAG: hypothetical protein JO122_18455 [Acetobacteraceae bacterium]|nr:hypothetical protein [Acetobacteraceae bacterium]